MVKVLLVVEPKTINKKDRSDFSHVREKRNVWNSDGNSSSSLFPGKCMDVGHFGGERPKEREKSPLKIAPNRRSVHFRLLPHPALTFS